MKRKTIRIVAAAFILFLIAVIPVAAFYARYEILTDRLEKEMGFEYSAANAVKHAYAAAELYSVLNIVLSDQHAESLVMSLGIINEYIERVTKHNKLDSLREIMKDLHNNQAGISAVQWQQGQAADKVALLDVIIGMAEKRILIVKRTDNPFYKGKDRNSSDVVGIATVWLDKNNENIKERIILRLR